MKRVPSKVAISLLAASGIRIQPNTLRTWTARGKITRTRAGYDPEEIEKYISTRGDIGQRRPRRAA